MSNHVHWILEAKINDGELANFKEMMIEMVQVTKDNEPGALNYEWSVSEDGTICHIYERYADSAATMVHMASFGKNFAKKFMALASVTGVTVYGNPDDTVRGALDAMGPVYMAPIGGFTRY